MQDKPKVANGMTLPYFVSRVIKSRCHAAQAPLMRFDNGIRWCHLFIYDRRTVNHPATIRRP
jgi:hypothetical protein